ALVSLASASSKRPSSGDLPLLIPFLRFRKSNFGRRRTCWSIISSARKASWTAQNFEG
ncbi:unnamed protein product, partial [Oikopleura dioica]